MFDITLPVAERWYDIFNIVLIIGAIAVAIATYGVIKMGAIKEHFADERISANEAKTARAIADSDIAKAQAAEANARAAEANKKAEEERLARLKIEARLAPRTLTGTQQQAIIDKIRPFAQQQFEFASYQEDQEVHGLVLTLIQTLLAAGWKGLPAREMLMGGLVVGGCHRVRPSEGQGVWPSRQCTRKNTGR